MEALASNELLGHACGISIFRFGCSETLYTPDRDHSSQPEQVFSIFGRELAQGTIVIFTKVKLVVDAHACCRQPTVTTRLRELLSLYLHYRSIHP
jgi:hypothetical protein